MQEFDTGMRHLCRRWRNSMLCACAVIDKRIVGTGFYVPAILLLVMIVRAVLSKTSVKRVSVDRSEYQF